MCFLERKSKETRKENIKEKNKETRKKDVLFAAPSKRLFAEISLRIKFREKTKKIAEFFFFHEYRFPGDGNIAINDSRNIRDS